MNIISLRTDNPIAEIGIYNNHNQLAYVKWKAHRQLAETIHSKLRDLLVSTKLDWSEVSGIICYQGPGSFTGLRIGMSVANSIATSIKIPIVAASGIDWQTKAIDKLLQGVDEKNIIPQYGTLPHITTPRK